MVVIDTSSLVNLVRYYLPFDRDKILYNFIEHKVEAKEILVIDKVYDECCFFSDGLAIHSLPFLKKHKQDTSECLPNKLFFHYANNDFINPDQRKKLKDNPEMIEIEKQKFLNGADAKMMLFCLKNNSPLLQPRIVTEETTSNNDSKLYKKIPTMCGTLKIQTLSLPELLVEYKEIVWDLKLVS
jgi:hypothetical protein